MRKSNQHAGGGMRTSRSNLWTFVHCLPLLVAGGAAHAGSVQLSGMAATLSGLPAAPFGERSVRIPDEGVGIRFRAPANATLAAVYSYWRRPDDGCSVALF